LPTARIAGHFPGSYAEARDKFIKAAQQQGASLASEAHPNARGAQNETLAIDAALLGEPAAPALLIVTSGTHGVEGFAGSGCQVAVLHDRELLERMAGAKVALLLVHALNPHGFSHLRRVNEDNVDLNRNFLRFDQPLPPGSEGYAEIHELLLPAQWPPSQENQAAIGAYIARRGLRAFQHTVTAGQGSHADGLFYSGTNPVWSNQALRRLVRAFGATRRRVAWIDLHTGLGPYGHGEKIYAGAGTAPDLARARRWWGADVFSPLEGESASAAVRGPAVSCAYDECPQAEITAMALEFGTQPLEQVLHALRADHWLHKHPAAGAQQRGPIKQALRDAFYVDSDEWRGMVAAQARVAVLQACTALAREGG
jgi:hypothetical protein